MLIVGEITARRERFDAVVAALTARSADLSLEVISYSDRLTQATAELQASIRTILDPALSIVAREVGPESTTLSTLTSARVIEETLRVSVRPIIDALAEPSDTTPPAAALAPMTPPATPHAGHGTIDIHDSIRPVLCVAPLRIIAIPFIIAITTGQAHPRTPSRALAATSTHHSPTNGPSSDPPPAQHSQHTCHGPNKARNPPSPNPTGTNANDTNPGGGPPGNPATPTVCTVTAQPCADPHPCARTASIP